MPTYHVTDFPRGPVQLQRTAPRKAVVMREFQFDSPTLGLIKVEAGFDTDYASVPQLFWNIYPPDGDYTDAAVVHDYLYWYQAVEGEPIERAEADRVFLEAMTAIGVSWLRRQTLYRAVRLGGWMAWKSNQTKKAQEKSNS